MIYAAAQIDSLAAEYVLGTLHGRARRRFQQLMTDRADVRRAVWLWESRLSELGSGLQPCKPPRRVWKNILRRIKPAGSAKMPMSDWVRGFWLALPAAAAAVWMAVVLLPATSYERLAVVADSSSDTLWVISADLDRGLLETRAMDVPSSAADSDYELWVLTADGPPLSLGLLAVGTETVETPISSELIDALNSSVRLAVSLEPVGGSPTGLPTGPIVYQATLLTL